MNIQLIDSAAPTSVLPSRLALLVLAGALFSRILVAAGLPTLFNFLHFPLLAISVVIAMANSRNRLAVGLLLGLFCLASTMAVSALLNRAGFINVVLDFLLLAEPFLLILIMIESRWPAGAVRQFRGVLLLLLGVHILMVYYQRWVLGLLGDDVRGLFLGQVAGAHVAGAVALTSAVYFGISAAHRLPAILFAVAAASVVVFADAKQVLVAFLAALLALMILRARYLRTAAQYLLIATTAFVALAIAALTFFPALLACGNPETAWLGVANKAQVFPLLAERCENELQWVFGLGPGHTIGRLGWLLPDYMHALAPIGATVSPTTHVIMDASHANWLSSVRQGSSMWSMLFSWAAILGDLGFAGLIIYALLWIWVARRICHSDLPRFLVLCAVVFGGIFSWLEEPAYVLLVASLVGLSWQEHPEPLPVPAA